MKNFLNAIWYVSFFSTWLALASSYISPEIFWWIAPFGLVFLYSYPLLCVIALAQIIQRQKKFFLTLVVLISGIPVAKNYVAFSRNVPINSILNDQTIVITNFNSMLFDLYNWFENHTTRPKIMHSLLAFHPDILCLQEFYTSEEPGDFNNTDSIIRLFSLKEYHSEFSITLRRTDHWGIATFSRYPIIRKGKIDFRVETNNFCIYTDMLVGTDTLRIYNFHLQSFRISDFLNHSSRSYEKMSFQEKIRIWYRRIRYGYEQRSRQADIVSAHIAGCRYPLIACGDLNDVPCSYAYRKMRNRLHDAFLVQGFGLGRTYSGKGPRFRIDYIFFSSHLRCLEFQKAKNTYTDHFPITAVFEFMQ